MPIPGLPNVASAPGLETWAERLATLPLIAQPGTKWSYSCRLDLLGRVIAVASGMSLEAFLQSRIFDPCGMRSEERRVGHECFSQCQCWLSRYSLKKRNTT